MTKPLTLEDLPGITNTAIGPLYGLTYAQAAEYVALKNAAGELVDKVALHAEAINRAAAENERLRAALEELRDGVFLGVSEYREIASEALEGKK